MQNEASLTSLKNSVHSKYLYKLKTKKRNFSNEKFKNKDKVNITLIFLENLFKKFKIIKCVIKRKTYILKTKLIQLVYYLQTQNYMKIIGIHQFFTR